MTNYKFEIIANCSKTNARAGKLHTPHGIIETPCFMPVGTQATVKGLTPEMIKATGAEIILANTYHLALRPGPSLIKQFGGLHNFMNWKGPILTDSGGYQVFSLSSRRKITEAGVTFQSHIDGRQHVFTPKNVIDYQHQLNSDIMMPLDVCTAYNESKKKTASDMAITHKWEKEAFDYWSEKKLSNWLFAIIQGGFYTDLRKESAEILQQSDFPGYAIGGLSVGEPIDKLHEYIHLCAPLLPENRPKYVRGIGSPDNLDVAIDAGIDMFDCVAPTRLARHGQVFINQARLNIKRKEYKEDQSPIDSSCSCYTCKHYSKAYLRHLFISRELLASTLLSIHNISYLIELTKKRRKMITKNRI